MPMSWLFAIDKVQEVVLILCFKRRELHEIFSLVIEFWKVYPNKHQFFIVLCRHLNKLKNGVIREEALPISSFSALKTKIKSTFEHHKVERKESTLALNEPRQTSLFF